MTARDLERERRRPAGAQCFVCLLSVFEATDGAVHRDLGVITHAGDCAARVTAARRSVARSRRARAEVLAMVRRQRIYICIPATPTRLLKMCEDFSALAVSARDHGDYWPSSIEDWIAYLAAARQETVAP